MALSLNKIKELIRDNSAAAYLECCQYIYDTVKTGQCRSNITPYDELFTDNIIIKIDTLMYSIFRREVPHIYLCGITDRITYSAELVYCRNPNGLSYTSVVSVPLVYSISTNCCICNMRYFNDEIRVRTSRFYCDRCYTKQKNRDDFSPLSTKKLLYMEKKFKNSLFYFIQRIILKTR